MSESVYFLSIGLPLATILLIFGMKYFSALAQARAQQASVEMHRQLAERAALAQEQSAQALAAIRATLADLGDRLVQVERILKDVE